MPGIGMAVTARRTSGAHPRHLARVCQRLKGVLIERRDAMALMRAQDTGDALFFVDPPYLPSTRDKNSGYRHELSEAAHIELLTLMRSLKGRVMVCGYPSELYDDMLHDWRRLTRKHYAASRGMRPRTEVLWISPP
jgi:DNA adenine methylase